MLRQGIIPLLFAFTEIEIASSILVVKLILRMCAGLDTGIPAFWAGILKSDGNSLVVEGDR